LTIASLAFKGVFRVAFIVLMALTIISSLAYGYLAGRAPKDYSGTTEETDFTIEVSSLAEQPSHITLRHTYPITVVREMLGYGYYVSEGPDRIDYNLTVRTDDELTVLNENTYMTAPSRIIASEYETSVENSDDYGIELEPGTYQIHLDATHPLDYSIDQKYKYADMVDGLLALGAIGLFSLLVIGVLVLRRFNALRDGRLPLPAPAMPQQGSSYAPYGRSQYAGQYPGPYRSPYWGQGQTGPAQEVGTDYVCAKCGNIIQNPVVQEIITCEKCGEKEYVGER